MGNRLRKGARRLLAAGHGVVNAAKATGPSLLVAGGLILLAYGVAVIYRPAGFIAAGTIAMLLGIGAMRR